MDPSTTPVGPLADPLPCPTCGRPGRGEVVRFANGAEHLRVHCRLHPGVYAPWDDAERKSRRLDGFSES